VLLLSRGEDFCGKSEISACQMSLSDTVSRPRSDGE
jgi:hypothetical protein